jgi:hypothetical protein
MKKITTISILAFLAISGAVTSCKKSSSTTPAPTPTTPTSSGTTPSPAMGNVDGGFVSLRTEMTTVTAGIPFAITSETGLATFFTATGNNSAFIDGGAVSVNTNVLAKQSNNSYLKLASIGMTPTDLSFSSGSNWSIGGAGSVPAFTFNHTVAFPTFTGTLPDSIVRSSGITVSLSGKVSNADSVILFVAQGSKYVSRTVAGSASSVSISATDLASLGVVTDKSAVLEVVPYRVTLHTQGSKTYAFIKELASVKNINIQ